MCSYTPSRSCRGFAALIALGALVACGSEGALGNTSDGNTDEGAQDDANSEAESTSTSASPDASPCETTAPGPNLEPTLSPSSTAPASPDNLGITPEIFFSTGGQVYSHHVTQRWLYFVGIITGGTGLFRIAKEPGAMPQLLLEGVGSSMSTFFDDGQHVYFLDHDSVLRRWAETEAESELPSPEVFLTLDGTPYYLGADDDSLFAMGNCCIKVSIIDRATREVRVIEPDGAKPDGGTFGIVSDGERLYCTGLELLFVIDKATGHVLRLPVQKPPEIVSITPWSSVGYFFEDGRIYANSTGSDHFGYLDVTTGAFTSLLRGGWDNLGPIARDRATGYLYFTENRLRANVWRYDRSANAAVRLMPDTLHITYGHGVMDDTHLYFVVREDPATYSGPEGIMRIRKPIPE